MSNSKHERIITKNEIRRTGEDKWREYQYRRNNEKQMNNRN